jgi:hypothetical protein
MTMRKQEDISDHVRSGEDLSFSRTARKAMGRERIRNSAMRFFADVTERDPASVRTFRTSGLRKRAASIR